MSGIIKPTAAFEMWSDHHMYESMRKMLHPGLADAAIWLIRPDDDAVVCMAALVAMIRRSDLVIAEVPDPERLRMVLARCYAVAEACGRVTSTWVSGTQTVVRFELQSVSA
jgi:hypothetical protein